MQTVHLHFPSQYLRTCIFNNKGRLFFIAAALITAAYKNGRIGYASNDHASKNTYSEKPFCLISDDSFVKTKSLKYYKKVRKEQMLKT
jgi:hypothetical protein